MANRLQAALDSATFGYTEEDLAKDIIEIESITTDDSEVNAAPAESPSEDIKAKIIEGSKKTLNSISGIFAKRKSAATTQKDDNVFEAINKLSELKDRGILTQEEFDAKKAELLSRL